MIVSFGDRATRQLWDDGCSRRFPPELAKAALRKLVLVHVAIDVEDLRNPPGNRLEMLRGDRNGQCSVRVNDQWRLCFNWIEGNAHDVEIVDYHR